MSPCVFVGVFISARTGHGADGRQFDRRLRGANGSGGMGDIDGGRDERRVTGNPSEALLSLFNYHPSLALPITPTRTHGTHTRTCAHAVGRCGAAVESLTKGGFVQRGWRGESEHGAWHWFLICF